MSRIEKLNELLSSNQEDSFLQHALALEYIKAGDENKAKILFESILEREPAYIGSYYHLGKLLERMNEHENAITVYERGMEEANKAGDRHTYNELQAAWEDASDQ